MLGIEHTNCRNCGTCCGDNVPITQNERMIIEDFVKTLTPETLKFLRITKLIVQEARNNKKLRLKWRKHFTRCQFRDEVNKKCVIYSVRPMICRIFGMIKADGDPKLTCTYGNSRELNLDDYMQLGVERFLMPDFLGKKLDNMNGNQFRG
jgi:hypothetical protein